MNAFMVIVLAALLVDYALTFAAEVLNLKSMRRTPPAGLEGVYQPDEYARSQRYGRERTRFGLIVDTFRLVVVLAFWFAGGFEHLDNAVRGLDLPAVPTGLVYIGTLVIGYSLLTLPFSVYSTFVIERRFGFNRTAPRTFVMDRIKGLALAVLLGGPLLAVVLAVFEYAGPLAWVYCWAAVTLFSLGVQFIAPTWIMPLFNRFEPLAPGELRDAIFEYARSNDFAIKDIFVMDGSKRSTKANAFFSGFGKSKRIALFDTLIENHTVSELVAVVAHEIGHYKKKHILKMTAIGVANTGVVFILLSLFLESQSLFDAFFMDETSVYAALVIFGLVYTPISMALTMVVNYVSRRHERQCDVWAAQTTAEPTALADALKKLSADNLSNLSPHPLLVFLKYDHPPLLERVRSVEQARVS